MKLQFNRVNGFLHVEREDGLILGKTLSPNELSTFEIDTEANYIKEFEKFVEKKNEKVEPGYILPETEERKLLNSMKTWYESEILKMKESEELIERVRPRMEELVEKKASTKLAPHKSSFVKEWQETINEILAEPMESGTSHLFIPNNIEIKETPKVEGLYKTIPPLKSLEEKVPPLSESEARRFGDINDTI